MNRWTTAKPEPSSTTTVHRLDGGLLHGGVCLEDLGDGRVRTVGFRGRGLPKYLRDHQRGYEGYDFDGYAHTFRAGVDLDAAKALVAGAHDELPLPPPRSDNPREGIVVTSNGLHDVQHTTADIYRAGAALSA